MMLSVILLSMLIILLFSQSVIRHLICGNKQSWPLILNLTCETLWTGAGSGLLIKIVGKTQLVLFDQSNNIGAVDVEMDGSAFEEKSFFKILGLSFFFLKRIGVLALSLLLKLTPRKLEHWFTLCLLRLFCISINLCGLAWNSVVLSELVLLAATRKCYISYKNMYLGLLMLQLLPVLNPLLMVEI